MNEPTLPSEYNAWASRLRDAEREATLLRAIVDCVPVMLYQWILTAAGEARFTFVSKGSELIYGLTPEQMMSDIRYSLEVVHPDDMPGFQRAVGVSAQDLTPFHWEGRVIIPSGTKHLRARSFPTRLADGATRWEGIILDVTDQHLADEARRASERERERQAAQLLEQNETLRRQAEALRELATPIIPLASDVIALPLIGDIDPERAQQILEGLLNGVTAHRARVAIIDITGVRSLDTFGAQTLIGAAQALRLLGATAVLTGIRPTIAQTLVDLGIDLGGLHTRASLQDGIAFAASLSRTRT
jgi:rsbT co-antagonist protein RsbR